MTSLRRNYSKDKTGRKIVLPKMRKRFHIQEITFVGRKVLRFNCQTKNENRHDFGCRSS